MKSRNIITAKSARAIRAEIIKRADEEISWSQLFTQIGERFGVSRHCIRSIAVARIHKSAPIRIGKTDVVDVLTFINN